ncbi:MAG TPA: hypothetical protein VIM55_09300 [Mucilaginibacter sp.]
MPIVTSMAMLALSISALIKGIDKHETWRIVLASVSGLIFIAMGLVTAFALYRTKKTVETNDSNE